MKLADYLYQYRMTPTQFGRLLGVTSRSTVHRYVNGDRIPEPRTLQKINHITNGKVMLDDFLDDSMPACANQQTATRGRGAICYPWSRGVVGEAEVVEAGCEDEPTYSPPLVRALDVLGNRAQVRGELFVLDGVPTDARGIVRAANQCLVTQSMQKIAYPGAV